jgi:hypothetical protein
VLELNTVPMLLNPLLPASSWRREACEKSGLWEFDAQFLSPGGSCFPECLAPANQGVWKHDSTMAPMERYSVGTEFASRTPGCQYLGQCAFYLLDEDRGWNQHTFPSPPTIKWFSQHIFIPCKMELNISYGGNCKDQIINN